ncbi:MAG TPA: hypothetical protein V6C89_17815 [Drouetiella sp.]|jgi:hypothetical protein
MNQILFATVVFATLCAPAFAGSVGNPELDGGTLSSLAAAFTGCYAAYRIYAAKRK